MAVQATPNPTSPAASGPAQDVSRLFGDGSASDLPGLLDQEQATRKESTPPKVERPAQAATAKPEVGDDDTATAARGKTPPPAKADETAAGGDEASAGTTGDEPEYPDELLGVLSRFGAEVNPATTALARANKELRGLQTRTAEDRNKLAGELEKIQAFIGEVAEAGPDGSYVLRADAAAKALGARNGRQNGDLDLPYLPTEAELRQAVVAEERKYLAALVPEDQLDEALKLPVTQAKIEDAVKGRMGAAKSALERNKGIVANAMAEAVHAHLVANPEDRELMPELDKFYGTFPPQVMHLAVLERWGGGIARIARLIRMEQKLPAEIRRVYDLGVAQGKKHVEPQDEGATGGGTRRAHKSGGGSAEEADQAYINAITGADKKPGISSILR